MSIYVQYQHAKKMIQLIQSLQDNIKVSISEFLTSFFDIDTCDSNGLDNWGTILNKTRTVLIPNNIYQKRFGFATPSIAKDSDGIPQNFSHGNFVNSSPYSTRDLDDDEYRALLKFVYLNYTTNVTLYTINFNMNYYYNPDGTNGKKVKVINTDVMEITYYFNFELQPYEVILFNTNGLLFTPIGTTVNIVYPAVF